MELPINIDSVECVTECWTYNRMIILKTSPYYEDWIASHYNLYVEANNSYNYSFFFGDKHVYTPEYYDDILVRRQIRYCEQSVGNVVDMLKEEIQKGYYINITLKPYPDKDWIHEIVLYGYDDQRKMFKAVGLEKRIFQKKEYDYKFIEDTLPASKEHFLNNKDFGLELSIRFQYPISAFRLREDYCAEGCAFGAYRKIKKELYGERLVKNSLTNPGVYEQTGMIYTGISCLEALSSYINDILAGNAPDRSLTQRLKKICEHRNMMMVSMKYLQKKWDKAMHSQMIKESIAGYQECSFVVQKWVNIALKYELTREKELLRDILGEIREVYGKEYRSLEGIVRQCIEWERFNGGYV